MVSLPLVVTVGLPVVDAAAFGERMMTTPEPPRPPDPPPPPVFAVPAVPDCRAGFELLPFPPPPLAEPDVLEL
ncbi:hypothetical protein EB118_22540 [bacterium]|nr:hypothetical protein [bacterium]